MTKIFSFIVFVVTLLLLGFFFLWPIYEILKGGFFNADGLFTLGFFKVIFKNHLYLKGLSNALYSGIFSTLLALLISLPLAYFSHKYEFPLKRILTTVILLPLLLPPFVGAIGIQQFFGAYGMLNSILLKLGILQFPHVIDWLGQYKFFGMVLMNALCLYPSLSLPLHLSSSPSHSRLA
jgi:iron(III) transport system permease protein